MSDVASFWDGPLRGLLDSGLITGYALITSQGRVEAAEGVLEEEFRCPSSGRLPDVARQFLGLFPPPTDQQPYFHLCGERAVVVRQEEALIQALSRGRRLGVLVSNLPLGVLVSTHGRSRLAQEVVPALERACEALRR